MDASDVYKKILNDMKLIWGDLAIFMLKKRVEDVHADPENLSKSDLEKIVDLLGKKTLPTTLGPDGAARRTALYRAWIRQIEET